jgi:hypothetical protein
MHANLHTDLAYCTNSESEKEQLRQNKEREGKGQKKNLRGGGRTQWLQSKLCKTNKKSIVGHYHIAKNSDVNMKKMK